MRNTRLFSGSYHPELANAVAKHLGIELAPCELGKFSNKETSVQISCSVRNQDIFVLQSCGTRMNDALIELLVMVSACKGGSATKITAVLPFFPYSKQCKLKKRRGVITARMVASLLKVAGVDHVITVDLHAPLMKGFFSNPLDNLSPNSLFINWIKENLAGQDITIVAKNAGGAKRVSWMADKLKVDFAVANLDKTRDLGLESSCDITSSRLYSENTAEDSKEPVSLSEELEEEEEEAPVYTERTLTVAGDIKGKTAVIIDDMIDWPSVLLAVAKHLRLSAGAKRVVIIATHGVFMENCLAQLTESKFIDKIVVTSTCPVEPSSKLEVLDISYLLGEAVRRTRYGESISQLGTIG